MQMSEKTAIPAEDSIAAAAPPSIIVDSGGASTPAFNEPAPLLLSPLLAPPRRKCAEVRFGLWMAPMAVNKGAAEKEDDDDIPGV